MADNTVYDWIEYRYALEFRHSGTEEKFVRSVGVTESIDYARQVAEAMESGGYEVKIIFIEHVERQVYYTNKTLDVYGRRK